MLTAQEVMALFNQYRALWKNYFASDARGTIELGLNNEQCMSIFSTFVLDVENENIAFTLHSSSRLEVTLHDLNKSNIQRLEQGLKEYHRQMEIQKPLSNEQFEDIKSMLRKYIKYDALLESHHSPLQLTVFHFTDPHFFKTFKEQVGMHWKLGQVKYDDKNLSITLNCDDPNGFQYDQGDLKEHLKDFVRERSLTTQECSQIRGVFENSFDEHQIFHRDYPVENKNTGLMENRLALSINFKSSQEQDAFQREVLPHLPSHVESTIIGSKKIELVFRRYDEKLVGTYLRTLFERMRAKLFSMPINKESDISFAIIRAIKNTMCNYQAHPQAVINKDINGRSYVSILMPQDKTRSDEHETFDLFQSYFERLCYKNGIEKLPGQEKYCQRKDLQGKYYKYEFYINPEDLHALLMEESPNYRGYREGFSIDDLSDPGKEIGRDETMYLFPVFVNPPDPILIRNAGCNVSEVLSAQLSFLVKKHLPELAGNASAYGHHISPIVEKKLIIGGEMLNQAALLCAGMSLQESEEYSEHEAMDGLVPLPFHEKNHNRCQSMTENAKTSYSLSAVTPNELESLQSFEVPMEEYLSTLITLLKQREDKEEHIQTIEHLENLKIKVAQSTQNASEFSSTTSHILSEAKTLHVGFKDIFKDQEQDQMQSDLTQENSKKCLK